MGTNSWNLVTLDATGLRKTSSFSDTLYVQYGSGEAFTAEVDFCAVLRGASSPFWIEIPDHLPPARVLDIEIRKSQIPADALVQWGDLRFWIEPASGSVRESNLRPYPVEPCPWQTATDSGRTLLWNVRKAAQTNLAVYLEGETGTGKEVLARLIHEWGPRSGGPFVPLHCAALPISLAESELFGHVKGSFTGADSARVGALLQAHGGTLFLDEVGDLPLDIQVKLLRFLENGEIKPLGSDRYFHANVRIVSATHKPLPQLVNEGLFRQDLFYRLSSICLTIPPLRDRPQDVTLLAKSFASAFKKELSPKALQKLRSMEWPGNVRQLRHAVERAVGMASHFQSNLLEEDFSFLMEQRENLNLNSTTDGILKLREMERIMIIKALKISYGNRAKAASILGVARSTLFEMLKRHDLHGQTSRFHLFSQQ